MKKCSICKVIKDIESFSYQNKSLGKRVSRCKECSKGKTFEYRNKDIEKTRENDKIRYQKTKEKRTEYARDYRKKYPERTRATNWKVKYGITSDEYYQKLEKQNNSCAICNKSMNDYKKHFAVDHNHTTGYTRGLLCDQCNHGLGFYEKNKDLYIKYLNEYDQ